MMIYSVQVSNGHIFEKHRRIFPDLMVGCHKRIICIHLRCLFIVISSPDLGDIADLVFTPVSDKADL